MVQLVFNVDLLFGDVAAAGGCDAGDVRGRVGRRRSCLCS